MNMIKLLILTAWGGILLGALVGCASKIAREPPTPAIVELHTQDGASQFDSALIAAGQKPFEANCAKCHTVNGMSNLAGPDLSDFGNEGWAYARVFDLLKDPQLYYPGTRMPTWDEAFSAEDIGAISAYIMSLKEQAFYLEETAQE